MSVLGGAGVRFTLHYSLLLIEKFPARASVALLPAASADIFWISLNSFYCICASGRISSVLGPASANAWLSLIFFNFSAAAGKFFSFSRLNFLRSFSLSAFSREARCELSIYCIAIFTLSLSTVGFSSFDGLNLPAGSTRWNGISAL